jgi:dephospho-CoA kinase
MIVIGLTGSIGSGKSTVATMLRNSNIPVIDADELARRAVIAPSAVLNMINERFGGEILNADKSLNRAALGKIVFANKEALRDLERIIHPAIEKLFYQELEYLKNKNYPVVFYMVPLLFEKNLEKRVDKTLLVVAPEEAMIARIQARDGLSEHEAKLRLSSQMSNEEKIARADVVLENNGTIDELFLRLKLICSRLCNLDLN